MLVFVFVVDVLADLLLLSVHQSIYQLRPFFTSQAWASLLPRRAAFL